MSVESWLVLMCFEATNGFYHDDVNDFRPVGRSITNNQEKEDNREILVERKKYYHRSEETCWSTSLSTAFLEILVFLV